MIDAYISVVDAFIYLAIGAAIVGLLVDGEPDDYAGYAVSIFLWPFIAITVACSMLREAVINEARNKQ